MESFEALLNKKLEELESEAQFFENSDEIGFSQRRAEAMRSKLSFLKSLMAAETGASSASVRLNEIASRVSAIESILSKTAISNRLRLVVLRKNVEELESMNNGPFSRIPKAKIGRKIAFVKSLLAAEAQSEEIRSLGERLGVAEKAFGHLMSDDDESIDLNRRKEIQGMEKERKGDDYDDVQKKIGFLRYQIGGEMKWKRFSSIRNEFVDRDMVLDDDDDDVGEIASSSCSCTSSCFDGKEEKEKQGENEKSVNGVDETGELCLEETLGVIEGKLNVADSVERSVEKRAVKLRAVATMVGLFVAAVVLAVVGNLCSEKEMVYFVPT